MSTGVIDLEGDRVRVRVRVRTSVIDLEGDGEILSMELVGNVFLNLGVNEGLRICSVGSDTAWW